MKQKYVMGSLLGSFLFKCGEETLIHLTCCTSQEKGKHDLDEGAIGLTKLSACRLKHRVLHTSWSVRYTRFRDLHEGARQSNQFIASLIGNDSRTETSRLFHLFLQR